MTKPNDVQDIVQRLLEYKQECSYNSLINPDGPAAADEIERLRAALQQSREAEETK